MKLTALLGKLYRGHKPSDLHDLNIPVQKGSSSSLLHNNFSPVDDGIGTSGEFHPFEEAVLPEDRFSKYCELDRMGKDPIMSGILKIHLGHALSQDVETGKIFTIDPASDSVEDIAIAAELKTDLEGMINTDAPNWVFLCCLYGVHYVRPYCTEGKGIESIESSHYTLARYVREYVRGNSLAGFHSEYADRKDNQEVVLTEPWTLVPIKIPFFTPNFHIEPTNLTGNKYSLFDDEYSRLPLETQNYGTSLLEAAYAPWKDLLAGLRSLRASRHNSSRIDRLISLSMEGADPIQASTYLRQVTTQLKNDYQKLTKLAASRKMTPSVINQLIPNFAGKGGVTIDTQQISADIQHIEDIMFHLKRCCSALGVDPSLIGWGDLMSGGLGDGGFTRTSINSAQTANWIRAALHTSIHRLIGIHWAFKHKKVFTATPPYKITFHAMNTAIETEQTNIMLGRAEYITAFSGAIDLIETGAMKDCPEYKHELYRRLNLSPELIKAMQTASLKAAETAEKDSKQGGMFESVKEHDLNTAIYQQILKLSEEDPTT